ncbi:MAG: ATP-binding protein, partial [Nitrospirota bacterium]
MQRPKWYQTLAFRFVFTFVLIILLIGVIIGTSEFIQHRRELNKELQTTGLFLALNLAHSLSDYMMYEDDWHINKELEGIVHGREIKTIGGGKIYPVVYAQLMGEDNRSSITYDPKNLIHALKESSSFLKDDYIIKTLEGTNESFYEIVVPVIYAQQKVGNLRIGLTKRYLDSVFWEMNIEIFVILGSVSILAIVMGLILFKNMTAPIIELSNMSLLFGQGKFHKRIPVIRNDEIGLLSSTFNFMAERLEDFTQDLREKNKELKRKNVELESFAYSISHDLKNPLISIQGFANILMKDRCRKFSQEEFCYLNRIKKNTEFMERLITSILELCRASRAEEKTEDVSVLKVIKEVTTHYQKELNDKQIKIILPEKMCVVKYHPQRLYEVFSNLIGNAIKFMDDKDNKEIRIEDEERGDNIQITVKDNGIGIDEIYHEKIFEPFHRLNKNEEIKGNGIGLTIVKRIIENYGGKIWVDSEPNKGTTFYFTMKINTVRAEKKTKLSF